MLIDKNVMINILSTVKPGLAKKGIIEQFTHFIFSGKEVLTYNDEICISYPFQTDFACSVKAVDLFKSLSSLKEHTVKIYLEGGELRIDTADTRGGLSISGEKDAEKLIEILDLSNIQWKDLPGEKTETEDHRGEEFLAGMFLCMFSCSKDMTQGVLTCININKDYLISSDELRISMFKLDNPVDIQTYIPARSVEELVKLKVRQHCLTNNWLHFKTSEGVTMSSRIMEGSFPDILAFLEIEGERMRLPLELKNEIEGISFMSDTEVDLDKTMDLHIEGTMIKCRAKKTIGWIEKDVPFTYKGNPVSVQINPIFFAQVMEKATVMKVSDKAALFVSGNFKHVISLV